MTGFSMPVILATLDPGEPRDHLTLPAGLTIADMIALALPGVTAPSLANLCVFRAGPAGIVLVAAADWLTLIPHQGETLVLRLMPGKGAFKSILSLLVTVAATAITGFFAGPIASAFGTGLLGNLVKGALGLGLTGLGGLLIASLGNAVPANKAEDRPRFGPISFRNELSPGSPVPEILGRLRHAPKFAAFSFTEVVGNHLFERALFDAGAGPVTIGDLRFGATAIDKYDEIEVVIHDGVDADPSLSLYNRQVIPTGDATELTRPLPRDDAGKIIPGEPAEAKPVIRETAGDASAYTAILSFPAGLIKVSSKGKDEVGTVTIGRRQRLAGTADWAVLDDIVITDKVREGFYRAVSGTFDVRGRYELEFDNKTAELDPDDTDDTVVNKVMLVTLQSFRPEPPLASKAGRALVELRGKSTAQFQGQIDQLNFIIARRCLDWDAGTQAWVLRETRRPASLARRLLQGPATVFPVPDERIDLPAFEAWHDYCVLKNLNCDLMLEDGISFEEAMAKVGAAGRAYVHDDGEKWTVIVDRPRERVIDLINPRNSSQFTASIDYVDPPDALRVSFADATNDYEPAAMIVPWPVDLKFASQALLAADLAHPAGTEAEVHSDPLALDNGIWVKAGASGVGSWARKVLTVTQELELPGNTDPTSVFIETRRHQHEIEHRAVIFSAVQYGAVRSAEKGDLVMISRDTLQRKTGSARVTEARPNLITLDEEVEMEAGKAYAIRFRAGMTAEDPIGQSVVRSVATVAGSTRTLRLTAGGLQPVSGDLVHFWLAGEDSYPAIIIDVEPGKDNSSVVKAMPSAEIIDTLTDAEIPYPWTRRVGAATEASADAPAIPKVTGSSIEGGTLALTVLLAPGAGSSVPVARYGVRHRETGDIVWQTELTCDAAGAAIRIEGYDAADTVEFQRRAFSAAGTPSAWSTTLSVTLADPDIIEAPHNFSVVAGNRDIGSGPAVVLEVAWDAPDDEDLRAEVQWLPPGSTFPGPAGALQPRGATEFQIIGVTSGDIYDVGIAFVDPFGDRSDWVVKANVAASWPMVLGIGGGFVLGIGGGKVLRIR